MKKRWVLVLAAAVLVVLGGGTGVLYAYDSARSDHIAPGITVAGIDVSGLQARAAGRRLAGRLSQRVQRSVTLEYADQRFVLSPAEARVHADLKGMVAAALAKSRDGSFFGRALRDLSGERIHASVPLQVAYSAAAIAALSRRVADRIDRPAKDASINPSGDTLNFRPSKNGIRVLKERLARAIVTQLRRPDSLHVVIVPTTIVKSKISSGELGAKYPFFITIARSQFRLRLWEYLQPSKSYPIAVGRQGLETPAGLYSIDDKQTNPSWHVPKSAWAGRLAGRVIPPGPADPIKARWLGFYNGAGIHGTAETSSLGSAASHGCIRMSIPDVIELYNLVPLHTPIFVG